MTVWPTHAQSANIKQRSDENMHMYDLKTVFILQRHLVVGLRMHDKLLFSPPKMRDFLALIQKVSNKD